MTKPFRTRLAAGAVLMLASAGAMAQARFFEHDNFRGRSVTLNQPQRDFSNLRFNDITSSVVIRGGSWEVCSDARFSGNCVVLRPGRYGSLRDVRLNDAISSARPVRRADAPPPWSQPRPVPPPRPPFPPGPPR